MPSSSDTLFSALQKASQSRAGELTSEEMNAFRAYSKAKAKIHKEVIERLEGEARQEFTARELEIHDHMDAVWSRLSEDDYLPDIHDPLVYADTATAFEITEKEAKEVYLRIEEAIFKKYG